MEIQNDFPLKELNSFGVQAYAKSYAKAVSPDGVSAFFRAKAQQYECVLVLGGGSNILFTKNYDGFVLHNTIGGMEMIAENERHVFVKAGGGVVWHNLVQYCIANHWGGIENLSLIPGTAGAAPVQNIGAYGVELADVFFEAEAVDLQTGETVVFSQSDCEFGYRNSIFKGKYKGRFFIASITLKLQKPPHDLHLEYGAIRQTLAEMKAQSPDIEVIGKVVCQIRQSKLPDPKVVGNAGSFFKNPELEKTEFEVLKARFGEMPHYSLPNGNVKVPAAWLIDQCGWKGSKRGRAGVHDKHALVLINRGGAKGGEILDLAMAIQLSVVETFGIELTPEVNVL